MPDELTELSGEETRASFVALREAKITEVRPPGADAARRALRRRRTVTSTAAGVAVARVAVLGGRRGCAHDQPDARSARRARSAPTRTRWRSTSTTAKALRCRRDELTTPSRRGCSLPILARTGSRSLLRRRRRPGDPDRRLAERQRTGHMLGSSGRVVRRAHHRQAGKARSARGLGSWDGIARHP